MRWQLAVAGVAGALSAAATPLLERVPGGLPKRLETDTWIPEKAKPCSVEHPLMLVVVRTADDAAAARARVGQARRFARPLRLCVLTVSPDSTRRIRRWLAGRAWPVPLGTGAAWARRLDRGRRVETYLWLPVPRRLLELRFDRFPAAATRSARGQPPEAFDLTTALVESARQGARQYDFDALWLLTQTLPFEQLRPIVRTIETGPPPEGMERDAVSRAYWWYRLRWIMAHADPNVSASELARYLRTFSPPPTPDPVVADTLRDAADALSDSEIVRRYLAAAPEDNTMTLTIRDTLTATLEQRPPETVETVVRQVAPLESSPWLRSLLAARYLYSVRPQQPDQLRFLQQWRATLPYYDLSACMIDSYLDAIEHGQDPFEPTVPPSREQSGP